MIKTSTYRKVAIIFKGIRRFIVPWARHISIYAIGDVVRKLARFIWHGSEDISAPNLEPKPGPNKMFICFRGKGCHIHEWHDDDESGETEGKRP